MKTEIKYIKDYLLLIDEEVTTNEINKNPEYLVYNRSGFVQLSKDDSKGFFRDKIEAYYPLTKEAKELDLPLLPNPFEEIDVVDLAEEKIKVNGVDYPSAISKRQGFIMGYQAAQPKQFSLEDVKKAVEMAREIKDNEDIFDIDSIRGLTEVCTYDWEERYSIEEIIQSLSTQRLPKEFIPEYKKVYIKYDKDVADFEGDGFIGESDELKTITNSEGKEVVQGKWIY